MSEFQNVRFEKIGGVGVITVDNPPVNALGPGVREGIIEALRLGNEDPGVSSFVLIGQGKNFIAGADIRQFGKARPVSTHVSAKALESSQKPVVAAINGFALGGGLEHALACHYRVGTPSARVGLPEVKLGILPAGGGTQRLSRLIGPELALDIILSSRHLAAKEALGLGILDEMVDADDLKSAAIEFAQKISALRPMPRTSEKTTCLDAARANPQILSLLDNALSQKTRRLRVHDCVIECVKASLSMDFEEGLNLERTHMAELENSADAKALRYVFFAEREVKKVPHLPPDYKPASVACVAIVGAGTMGSGIAVCFADRGVPVTVLEASPENLERGLAKIAGLYAARVKSGKLTDSAMQEALQLIEGTLNYTDLAQCDAVIEAVFERIDLKKEVFTQLDAVMKPGALLLTNSSAIDINTMAQCTTRPQDVAGAHFFAPANVMKLCEIVKGDQTSPEVIARAMKMGGDIGKVTVLSGTCDGFAANRSRAALVSEAMLLLEEGASPYHIDQVMREFGYPMGPFAVSDLSGLDVSYDTRKRRAAANPNFRKLHVPDHLVELGRHGQKTKLGWYRYEDGSRVPQIDEGLMPIITALNRELGVEQKVFSDDEILKRLLFASVNEACKILQEGKAYRASDIDVMWIYGFGFPRYRGGLMFWADTVGVQELHRQITQWHAHYGERWRPAELLNALLLSGETLRELRSTAF